MGILLDWGSHEDKLRMLPPGMLQHMAQFLEVVSDVASCEPLRELHVELERCRRMMEIGWRQG